MRSAGTPVSPAAASRRPRRPPSKPATKVKPAGTRVKPAAAQAVFPAWRFHAVAVVIVLAMAALAVRVVQLATAEGDFLKRQGEARAVRVIDVPVHRGMIFDRHGEPLAVSAPMHTVWVDPQQASLPPAALQRLADALGSTPEALQRRLNAGSRRFAYLARRVPPAVAEQVAELAVDGVQVARTYHRFYPAGETTAHLVGRTNIDDAGQEGIELALEATLAGAAGSKRVLKRGTLPGGNAEVVKDLGYVRRPEYGEDVHLALDLRLQFLAYRELKAAVQHHGAASGSLVMLDAASGEVLALANQPSFNPNDWRRRGAEGVRNRAITDLYEPGSTVKPLTVLAALEGGLYTPETEVDTAPGYFRIGTKVIEDPVNRGRLTVAAIVAKSSQVGIAKMALAMPSHAVYDALHRAGFGDYTGCGLPGEAIGMLAERDLDKDIGRASLAYGYGLTASPMQIARAYLTLASGGVRKDVSVLRGTDESAAGMQVFAPAATAAVTSMLRGVLARDGTAPKARPPGYTAAGKTGTVRKVTASGYDDTAHVAYFAGFAPASAPRIVLVVVVDEPRRGLIGGGDVAAPVFARVAARALRALGVPPDDMGAGQAVHRA